MTAAVDLLDTEKGITVIRKSHEKCSEHYRIQTSLCNCNDINCLMEKLEFQNDPEEWGLLSDASKLRLKASLLQIAKANRRKLLSIQWLRIKNRSLEFSAISHKDHSWQICG